MKLRDDSEPRLEAASEPRLDVRDPRLLPDEQDSVLADRLRNKLQQESKSGLFYSIFGSLFPPQLSTS